MNKLEILEFEALDYAELYIPEEFLRILLQSCHQTLTKLALNSDQGPNTINGITRYLESLPFIVFRNVLTFVNH